MPRKRTTDGAADARAAFHLGVACGWAAFRAGRACVPVHDPALPDAFAVAGSGTGAVLEVLTGWHRGWAQANLAAATS